MPQLGGLDGLGPAWRAAFEEAWASAQAGNYGVGAVLVDPSTDGIVARGRNRVAEDRVVPGLLAGNMTAHAEMNAFAALDRFNASGLHLYTTLEPCLMCAASAMMLKVEAVHFAAGDEFYDDLDDVWQQHPLTAQRRPVRTGPFGRERAGLASFGRLLPMTFTLDHFPGSSAEQLARERHPRLAAFVDRLRRSPTAMAEWRARDLDAAIAAVVAHHGG